MPHTLLILMTSIQHATPVCPEIQHKYPLEKSVTQCQQTSKHCILKQKVWPRTRVVIPA